MEDTPLFSYLFSSPLVRENSDGTLSEVDILDYITERRELKLLLEKKAGGNIRWKSEVAKVNNFLNAYSNSKILHFTGHGEHGVMAFEDKFGKLKFITQTELSEMCRGLTDKPECIFLSACFAQTVADAFVDAGIKHIVTVTNDRVLDKANLEFTDTFYSALISGKSVSESFNLGIARLVALYPSERLKFDLKGNGDHSEAIFTPSDLLAQRPLVDETPPLPLSQCSSPTTFFIGRHVEVQQVFELLRNDMKTISITGTIGVGKTEVALRLAEYARERHTFSRSLYVEMNKIPNCSEKTCLDKLTNAFNVAHSTIFEMIEYVDVESVVEVIRGSVRPEENVLLILDGVDSWVRKKREFFLSLVVRLRQRLGDVLWIVLTSQQNIELDSCREVVVDRLTDVHAAQLFVLRAPRSLDRDELTLEANESHKDPIQAFSRTKLLQSMKGNPAVVSLVARELQFDGQPQNMMRYETFFREEIIPSILAQVLSFSADTPTWQDVCGRLRNTYRRTMGIEACRARPLTLEDIDFFAKCSAWGKDECIPAKNRYVVVPSSLDSFLPWFEGVLMCLKGSALWSRPHCIFGFVDRIRAAELLKESDPGTFLIGVSQSEPCLVINVVKSPGRVLPVKVKVDTTSPTPFSYVVKNGMTNCFMTLEDLLISNPQLQFFFPFFPVEGGPINKLTLLSQT